MPLDFPSSPTPGQRYPASGDPSWTWNDTNGTWDFNRPQVDHVGNLSLTNNELEDFSFTHSKLNIDSDTAQDRSTIPLSAAWTPCETLLIDPGDWLVTANWEIYIDGAGSVECRLSRNGLGVFASGYTVKGTSTNLITKSIVSLTGITTVPSPSAQTILAEAYKHSGPASSSLNCQISALRIG